MNIVIIEDEKPLAVDLTRTILTVAPEAKVLKTIVSVEDAILDLPTLKNVDLIFSDIKLGDGLSFEIFTKLENTIPIVFCTAFDHYALQAFDSMGIDYILKPISKESVLKAIQKFNLLRPVLDRPYNFKNLVQDLYPNATEQRMKTVVVHYRDKIIPVSGNDIAMFVIEEDGNYAYTFSKEKWKINQSIDALENIFSPYFYRANRQFLINRSAILSASPHTHRKVSITLNIFYSKQIVVGKEKVTSFLTWLSNV